MSCRQLPRLVIRRDRLFRALEEGAQCGVDVDSYSPMAVLQSLCLGLGNAIFLASTYRQRAVVPFTTFARLLERLKTT